MATAMETKYEVIDEELMEAVPSLAKGKRKVAEPTEADAAEVATLIEQTVQKALSMGAEQGVANATRIVQKEVEALRTIIAKESEKVLSLGKPLCLFVKLGEQPVKKLKQRVSPLLPDLLMQIDIGQGGGAWPCVMGPSGSGKTVAAGQVAEAKSAPYFAAINGSPDIGLTSLFGRETAKGFIPGPLWIAATQGGGMFFDEMDAFAGSVLVGLNAVTSAKVGQLITNPISGETLPLHKDSWFIAAMNTNGKGGDGSYTGRERLDAASLNRFSLFELQYDTELERSLCGDKALLEKLWTIRVALGEKKSKDIVSTRDIANAYAQLQRGYPMDKILACLARRMDKSNQELFGVKGGK